MIDFKLSEHLKTQYRSASPFPYIVIDNFLPEFLLNKSLEELENHDYWYHNITKWIEEYEINKFYTPNHDTDIPELRKNIPITSFIFDYLNSDEFIKFLKNLTGFDDLESDKRLLGGGVHKIISGGKLSVHKDYNVHPETKKHRKLNLLLYLNKNWESDWNGNLEFWNKNITKKVVEIEPTFNRAVIFSIENAPHGHPIPLNTPEGVSRYSLALYYFSDEIPKETHTVVFYKTPDEIFKF
jgi:hypothetical protein